ncbi:MAG: UDP-N-acetylmuramoylalanyl-D-glutamate--2,6-diaminopimelate ligase, partial [Mariprofundales bacterium]|nr:UDP-N-acetylmuramoylalanyl-D-glutamate--2,6-diaminopimelate ligase [Mariprofundales bacterium]
DRDRSKRAQMGAVAARGADMVWVTEDNSRSEDPRHIAEQVVAGMESSAAQVSIVLSRAQAIAAALRARGDGDLLLIAGKGHEEYIERGGVRTPWSDAECVRDLLAADRQAAV